MEQPPRRPEGGDEQLPHEAEPTPWTPDAARARAIIEEGLNAAEGVDREIDDWVAGHIARQLSTHDGSALNVFARTGEVAAGLRFELVADYESQPARTQRWINFLGTYCVKRGDPGPVERWAERAEIRNRFDAAWRAAAPWSVRYVQSRRVNRSIQQAQEQGRLIDDVLAMDVLVQLASSPHGAIARFVADGRVTDALRAELAGTYLRGGQRARLWIDQLDRWVVAKTGTTLLPSDRQEAAAHHPVGKLGRSSSVERTKRLAEPAHETTARVDCLVGLDERLAPLPDLGDIPQPGPVSGTGYDWMEALPDGWHAEPLWGRDGWDLGAWPVIAVALFVDEERERYAVATYTEGDVTVQRYASRGALYVAVNEIAEFHWRLGQSIGPDDLPEGSGLLTKHCGPYRETERD